MDFVGVIMFLMFFGIPIVFGAVFGFAFGFVPSAIVRWLMTFAVGGGALWIFASTLYEAQGGLVGIPAFLVGFGFVAALWLTVGIRSYRRENRVIPQNKAPA